MLLRNRAHWRAWLLAARWRVSISVRVNGRAERMRGAARQLLEAGVAVTDPLTSAPLVLELCLLALGERRPNAALRALHALATQFEVAAEARTPRASLSDEAVTLLLGRVLDAAGKSDAQRADDEPLADAECARARALFEALCGESSTFSLALRADAGEARRDASADAALWLCAALFATLIGADDMASSVLVSRSPSYSALSLLDARHAVQMQASQRVAADEASGARERGWRCWLMRVRSGRMGGARRTGARARRRPGSCLARVCCARHLSSARVRLQGGVARAARGNRRHWSHGESAQARWLDVDKSVWCVCTYLFVREANGVSRRLVVAERGARCAGGAARGARCGVAGSRRGPCCVCVHASKRAPACASARPLTRARRRRRRRRRVRACLLFCCALQSVGFWQEALLHQTLSAVASSVSETARADFLAQLDPRLRQCAVSLLGGAST